MFNIGLPELILILVVALIVLGPRRLPEIAKALGRGLAEFKRATEEVKRQIEEEVSSLEKEVDVSSLEEEVRVKGNQHEVGDHKSGEEGKG